MDRPDIKDEKLKMAIPVILKYRWWILVFKVRPLYSDGGSKYIYEEGKVLLLLK